MDRYAVFGNPIAQSKSPRIHTLFAEQFGDTIEYSAELVELDGFVHAADAFFTAGGSGLNITVPFKQEAFRYTSSHGKAARLSGAVNTLRRNENDIIVGENTDGVGICRDITENLGWQLQRQNILLLGAGGAVRGVLPALLGASPSSIVVANRTASKAEELASLFAGAAVEQSCSLKGTGYDAVPKESFDVVINGTSASLDGKVPHIPEAVVGNANCYDMMYGNEDTPFIAWARQQGAGVLADGLGMLVEQAAEAFFLWRDKRPETAAVIEALRES